MRREEDLHNRVSVMVKVARESIVTSIGINVFTDHVVLELIWKGVVDMGKGFDNTEVILMLFVIVYISLLCW